MPFPPLPRSPRCPLRATAHPFAHTCTSHRVGHGACLPKGTLPSAPGSHPLPLPPLHTHLPALRDPLISNMPSSTLVFLPSKP